jgi:hypothetical protein
MTNSGEIAETIRQYAKHGWVLRRVLLSEAARRQLGEAVTELFGGVPITVERFDGIWFSRSSRADSVAWELRRLGGTPYALVTTVAENASADDIEAALSTVADRMRATVVRGN